MLMIEFVLSLSKEHPLTDVLEEDPLEKPSQGQSPMEYRLSWDRGISEPFCFKLPKVWPFGGKQR